MIEISNLSKFYTTTIALNSVSFNNVDRFRSTVFSLLVLRTQRKLNCCVEAFFNIQF